MAGEWRGENVEADDLALQAFQAADQRLAEVSGASGDQDFHAGAITFCFAC
jgi:hypothetical protein